MISDKESTLPTEYLIDHLRSNLSKSPVTHSLTVNVIESCPKRTTSLFPYIEDTPKVWAQQVLVTVAADVKQGAKGVTIDHASAENIREEQNATNAMRNSDMPNACSNSASSKNNGKLFLCAMEAYVFHVPTTSSCLVYISKVDSTGYHPTVTAISENPASDTSPSNEQPRTRLPPITYYLLKAFLSFYHPLSPSRSHQIQRPFHHRHVYVTLFARSATQYLFPNSVLGGKKVLGGVKLCKWWRRTFEDVILDLQREQRGANETTKALGFQNYLTYFLPAYDHLEARSLVGINASPTIDANTSVQPSEHVEWRYLPPADPSLNSLLFPPSSNSGSFESEAIRISRPLGMVVPTFDDDPKARFLVELVMNSPLNKLTKGKTRRHGTVDEVDNEQPDRKRQKLGTDNGQDVLSDTSTPTVNNSSALDATSSSNALKDVRERRRNDEMKLRQQDEAALTAVSWDDFWTRMGYRQECISGDVTGFFSMYVGLPVQANAVPEPITSPLRENKEIEPPQSAPHQISHPLFARIGAALLNHDFANLALAIEGTRRFLDQTENIVVAEIGEELWKTRCFARVERNEEGKAFETRRSGGAPELGGAVAAEQSSQPVVNVLQVRKKKKPSK
ncbi:hypothetical protein QFC19_000135 [Naganishia cerealis]|uniref:Uncharacterized protein n=1 Tax=Naganishia cerealis TaxID=610337 RepID=A0ACC2WRY8_9TREE|nr:hypothetical protein QFC19_000135 [Naganishia cerealis]